MSWWEQHKAVVALAVAVGSATGTLIVGVQGNSISGQIRDLNARVDINLVNVTHALDTTSKGHNFTIELSNAGPGVASHVVFGLTTTDFQDVPSDQRFPQAIAVNGSTKGTVYLSADQVPPQQQLPGQKKPVELSKLVDVWVKYKDGLNNSYRLDFPSDQSFRKITTVCGLVAVDQCLRDYFRPTPTP